MEIKLVQRYNPSPKFKLGGYRMETKMSFVEFTEKLREEVSKQSGREFELNPVVKNNGAVYVGMITVEKSHIVPTIYLEPFCYCRRSLSKIRRLILSGFSRFLCPAGQ